MSQGAHHPARFYLTAGALACLSLVTAAAVLLAGDAKPASAPSNAPMSAPVTAPTSRPAPAPRILFAEGSADRFWIAVIEPYTESGQSLSRTRIRMQIIPGGQWRELVTLTSAITGLERIQGDAVVTLDDGAWRRINQALSTGPTVPGIGPMRGWAWGPGALYAARDFVGGRAAATAEDLPTTRPATTRSVAVPATRPAAARPETVLFSLEQGQWHAVGELPPGLWPNISMAVTGGQLVLVGQTEPTSLHTFAWAGGKWEDWGTTKVAAGATFALVEARESLALWSLDQDGNMQVALRQEGKGWGPAKPLESPAGVTAADRRAFTAAGEEFRLIVLRDGKIWEQRYGFDAAPRGTLVELPQPIANRSAASGWMLNSLVVGVMVLAILFTLSKRKSEGKAPPSSDKE